MVDPADKDPRLYIKVHNGMPEHPKIEGLSDAAFRLLVSTWCWSDRNNTDGAVPEKSRRKRGTPKAWRELFDAGLAEPATDGAMMHDYLEHQRSAAEKISRSETARRSGQKGGKARAEAQALAKQTLEQTGSKIQAELDVEKEKDLSYVGTQGGGSVPAEPQAPTLEPLGKCPRHPDGTDEPCGICAEIRRRGERRTADLENVRAAELRRQLELRRRCTDCDENGFLEDADRNPIGRCDHPRLVAQPESRTA